MGMVVRVIALPAAGGVPVQIAPSQALASRMLIEEDGLETAGVMQGLIGNYLTQGPFKVITVGPQTEWPPNTSNAPTTIEIAGYPGDHPPNTVPIGGGVQIQLTSLSADPVHVRVTDWT